MKMPDIYQNINLLLKLLLDKIIKLLYKTDSPLFSLPIEREEREERFKVYVIVFT